MEVNIGGMRSGAEAPDSRLPFIYFRPHHVSVQATSQGPCSRPEQCGIIIIRACARVSSRWFDSG